MNGTSSCSKTIKHTILHLDVYLHIYMYLYGASSIKLYEISSEGMLGPGPAVDRFSSSMGIQNFQDYTTTIPGSTGLEYLPTFSWLMFMVFHVGKYTSSSHGSYGYSLSFFWYCIFQM